MNCRLNFSGPQSRSGSPRLRNIFHDVYLAPSRPFPGSPQHPERRPQSGANRKFQARFHPPVLKIFQPQSFESRGSPRSSHSRFFANFHCANNQMPMTVLKCIGIFCVARHRRRIARRAINFQLMIAPSASANIKSPFTRIRCGAGFRGVEFVAPHRLTPRLRAGCNCKRRGHKRRCTHDPPYLCNRIRKNSCRRRPRGSHHWFVIHKYLRRFDSKVQRPPLVLKGWASGSEYIQGTAGSEVVFSNFSFDLVFARNFCYLQVGLLVASQKGNAIALHCPTPHGSLPLFAPLRRQLAHV